MFLKAGFDLNNPYNKDAKVTQALIACIMMIILRRVRNIYDAGSAAPCLGHTACAILANEQSQT